MRIDATELYVGEPDFPYTPILELEAKSEARTAFGAAPTHDAVNAQLRDMAAKVGAEAVIRIEYNKGVSMTSWNSLKGTGLAVKRALASASHGNEPAQHRARPAPRPHHAPPKPLRCTDNNHMPLIILAVIGGLLLL